MFELFLMIAFLVFILLGGSVASLLGFQDAETAAHRRKMNKSRDV